MTENGTASTITLTYGFGQCSLGWLIVAATERGVCAIQFGDDPVTLLRQLRKRFPQTQLEKAGSGFTALIETIVDFVERPGSDFRFPLDIQGTDFQKHVWSVLRQTKPGETLSYSEVAERIGQPQAVRAVATACGANKLAVIIPCHRVIAKDETISGYRWGVERKERLLEREGVRF